MSSIVAEVTLENPPELSLNGTGAETTEQIYTLSVPSLASNPIKVTASDGSYFSWQPSMLMYQDEFGIPDYLIDSLPSTLTTLGRQARYLRSFDINVDDVFHAQPDRVKHWTILNEPPRPCAGYLSGDIIFGISGVIQGISLPLGIQNEINSGSFSLPKPVITDLTGQEVEGYYEVITIDNNSQQLNIWFDSSFLQTAVYPVMIDPTVVVASSYSPSNTARPQILSNGWIVTCEINAGGNVLFQVSKDNGVTFTPLCSTNNTCTSGFAMASKGTIIYFMGTASTGSGNFSLTFDATTVTNTGLAYTANIDTGQSSFGTGNSIAINSTGTVLTAVWCSKNASFSGVFNIRSAKSVDGGVTWTMQNGSAGADQVTNNSGTSVNSTLPYVQYDKNNNPVIVFLNYNGNYNVENYTWSGSAWVLHTVYNFSWQTSSITLLLKKYGANTGRIWCVCSSGNSYYNIEAFYSDDNGATWSAVITVTTGTTVNRQNATLSEKPNGDIIVMYDDNGTISYQVCANGGTAFTGLTVIGTGTLPSMSDTLNNMTIYMWKTSTNVQADKFLFNTAPNAPSLTTKSNFDATTVQNFNWTFSDPDSGDSQSAYELIITRVSDSVVMKDTGKVSGTAGSYSLPTGILANGIQYQWKVMTWDSSSVSGPYSTLGTFSTALTPTVSITSPATDGTVLSNNTVVTGWNTTTTLSQGSYQVRLTDNSDVQLWSSGQLSGTNNLLTVAYALANLTNYKLKVTVWDTYGIQSVEVVRLFSASFTPPAIPTLSNPVDNIRGAIILNITNPTPTGSQPSVTYNDIYRMASDETVWTRIATNIANTFTDYTPMHNKIYKYKATAIGSNTSTTDSNIVAGYITINYVQIANTTNYSQYVMLMYYDPKIETVSKPKASMLFAGREYSVSEFGEHSGRIIPFVFHIKNVNDLNTLRALVDSKQNLLYRDNRGRKMFCTIDTLGVTDQYPNSYDVTINPEQVSYSEVV